MKHLLLSALGLAVVAQALVAPVGAGPRNSPANEIEIVTVNLQEAYTRYVGDLADNFEIGNFVDRVVPDTPYLPDVLLLQEVNYKTTGLVARRLTRRTGQRYVVAVRPIRNTTIEYPDKAWNTDTGIVINAKTMAVAKRGRFYTALYPDSATAPGERINVRRHAHVLLRERGTGLRVPVASVHFAHTRDFRSRSASDYWRGVWARKLESIMKERYGAGSRNTLSTIGGDFNAVRCVSGSFQTCKQARFWSSLTGAPHVYSDSLFDLGLPMGVDMLFTDGDPQRGGIDEHGKFPESDRRNYYSDHTFRWVLVTP